MLARMWHGRTVKSNYEAYSEFLIQKAIPDYKNTPGFRGLSFLRNIKDHEAHFYLITYWDDLETIKNFAGRDVENAKYYPEDNYFLLEKEKEVQHFEVFAFSAE